MLTQLRAALVAFVCLTLLTGVAYPLLITAAGRVAFADQAGGSFIQSKGMVVGSRLIGQPFEGAKYFWGRLSATGPFPYNAGSSSPSNLGPSNPALEAAVDARIKALTAADPSNVAAVPVDLVTGSGSGLDPEISPAAAYYQVGRVARARGLDVGAVRKLVDDLTQRPTLGVLGEARVNVLALNLALDGSGEPAAR
jgi:K+-transporting ATPase ATPase C chain